MFPNIWTVLNFFCISRKYSGDFETIEKVHKTSSPDSFETIEKVYKKTSSPDSFGKLFIRFNSLSEDNFSRLVVNFLFKPFQKLIYLAFLRQGAGCEKSQKDQNQLHIQFLLFNKTKVRLSPTQLHNCKQISMSLSWQ